MNTPHVPHVTMTAPQGMRGAQQCPAERIGTPESGSHSPSRGRGALVWAVVASVLAAATVAFGQGPTSYIFGVDDSSDLWVMNLSGTTSGTASLLFSSTQSTKANGLAYDSFHDQLLAVDQSGSNSYLWWWQTGKTSYTSLGTISGLGFNLGNVVSAAYYDNAYWFLGDANPGNRLGKISLSYSGTGASAVPIGVSGTTFTIVGMSGTTSSGGGDLVITPAGTLYAFSAPGFGNFFSVNVTTASSGTVGGYNLIKTSSNTGLQLAFGVDGTTLYGTDHLTGNWYSVNTSNGNLTQIPGFQTLPGGFGFNDLAGPAGDNPLVPEPSTYAMALAGLACGGFSMWRRRKRA